jgi:hypothetical protein
VLTWPPPLVPVAACVDFWSEELELEPELDVDESVVEVETDVEFEFEFVVVVTAAVGSDESAVPGFVNAAKVPKPATAARPAIAVDRVIDRRRSTARFRSAAVSLVAVVRFVVIIVVNCLRHRGSPRRPVGSVTLGTKGCQPAEAG